MRKKPIFSLDPDQLERLLSVGTGDPDPTEEQDPQADNNKPGMDRENVAQGEHQPAREQDPSVNATASLVGMERPGSQIGRYKLLRVLGEGGMGLVYLAEQEGQIRRKVALKVIKPGMDSKRVIARFETERQALALLDHPGVAQVYDAGTTETGRPYFIMEHVRGLPITDYCDRHKLTVENRLRLFQQVCLAVHHAHQKGIIHRDIKPSNILVSTENDRPIPKMIDFGVAKAISQPLTERTLFTEDSHLLGTPEYMSPEQADMSNEDIDTRSDIYSLGVLLYVLLTGILPYDSKTFRRGGVEHIRRIIRDTDPKTPSTRLAKLGDEAVKLAENRRTEIHALAKHLKKELEWIPLKAMRKDRAERYRSASELVDDIENYLNGAPLMAGPPGTGYKLKKFVRRNRVLVGGIAAVLVVLIAGVVVSTNFAIRAERQATISQAVVEFLTEDVLMSAHRAKATRWEVTLSEILDVASQNLKDKFNDEPLVEALIRHTLGNTYLSLGKYLAAEPHIESAYRIRRVELGQEHPDTLASTSSLGILRLSQGRHGEAEQLCSKAFEGRLRLLGREHQDTLTSMWELGVVYVYQHRYTEAEKFISEVSDLRNRILGQEHPDTLTSLRGLAWTYMQQARYAEAEQLFEHVFETCLENLGDTHDVTRGTFDGLVSIYTHMDRLEEAEQHGRKGLELKRHALGEEHPETLESMGILARVYAKQGRYEEAEQLYKTVHETQRRLGIQVSKVTDKLVELAALYVEQARYGEAEPLLLQEFQRREQQFGPVHDYTIDMLNQVVSLYEAWHKPDEANEWRSKLTLERGERE